MKLFFNFLLLLIGSAQLESKSKNLKKKLTMKTTILCLFMAVNIGCATRQQVINHNESVDFSFFLLFI
jgi:hypothetical protein